MRRPLLSTRATLVLLIGVLTGIGAGVLAAAGGVHAAQCVLYGAGAFGVSVPFVDRLIAGPEQEPAEKAPAERAPAGTAPAGTEPTS
ncbi:hypothetical protein ACIQWA_01315 [Kitasatospora sp. NPDC098652]|uniref:hypothetical protein n=1 Tax=Kitasatospora sp. NPDC098652 TaxID=3364095 RepID=UPI0038244862